jgi:hypothetical protein
LYQVPMIVPSLPIFHHFVEICQKWYRSMIWWIWLCIYWFIYCTMNGSIIKMRQHDHYHWQWDAILNNISNCRFIVLIHTFYWLANGIHHVATTTTWCHQWIMYTILLSSRLCRVWFGNSMSLNKNWHHISRHKKCHFFILSFPIRERSKWWNKIY